MYEDRRVRLDYGWLARHRRELGGRGSLVLLAVVPAESPADRLRTIQEACEKVGRASVERILPVFAHEVEPDRLEQIVAERIHLAIAALASEPQVMRGVGLLAQYQVPRLLLATAGSLELLRKAGLDGSGAEVTVPRSREEALTSCESFVGRLAADADAHRQRRPALLAHGGQATRQRAMRSWEQLPDATRDTVAACNGMTNPEVRELLGGSAPLNLEQTMRLAQLELDLRQALGDYHQVVLWSDVLRAAEIKAFRTYCARSRLPVTGDVARALFRQGEQHARTRQRRHVVGAETRLALGHWTHWSALREA